MHVLFLHTLSVKFSVGFIFLVNGENVDLLYQVSSGRLFFLVVVLYVQCMCMPDTVVLYVRCMCMPDTVVFCMIFVFSALLYSVV